MQGHVPFPSQAAQTDPSMDDKTESARSRGLDVVEPRRRTDSGASASPRNGRSSPSSPSFGSRKRAPTDPRYRRYAQQIDKCLATFGDVTEWADFTAFLARLHKAIQLPAGITFPSPADSIPEIPHKLVIAKRLAQGLNPALPNGVHQLSLSVYREVFTMLGPEGLARDLQIWSAGFLPFFQYAAEGVRPQVLEIYETFYLPLQGRLSPIAKALAISLLPGIEEETGDHHERVVRLLDAIADAVGPGLFHQCLFLILITHPGSRLSAINYLNRRLAPILAAERDDPQQGETFRRAVGMDTGLIVRACVAAVGDENVLVRRGALDFVIGGIPVTRLLSHLYFSEGDAILLARSACAIVLRRDLSLSRRLYTWLLGPTAAATAEGKSLDVLPREVVDLLVRALDPNTSGEQDLGHGYRIFIALLDKWEIGYPLSRAYAYPALADLYSQNTDDMETMRITAQSIVNAVEPFVVWSSIYARLTKGQVVETLQVVEWILQSFPVTDREVSSVHAPLMVAYLVTWLNDEKPRDVTPQELDSVVHILEMLISHLAIAELVVKEEHTAIAQLMDAGRVYYTSEASLRPPPAPTIFPADLPIVLFQNLTSATILEQMKTCLGPRQHLRLLQAIVEKIMGSEVGRIVEWERESFLRWVEAILEIEDMQTLLQVTEIVAELEVYSSLEPRLQIADTSVPKDMQLTAFRLLQRTRTSQHAELVSVILRIHNTINPLLLEKVIMECLCKGQANMRESVAAFGALWNASVGPAQLPLDKPMFYLLDQIDSDHPARQRAIQAWFKQELAGYVKMIDRILSSMLSRSPAVNPGALHVGAVDYDCLLYQKPADTQILAYHVSKLHDVVRLGGRPLRTAMEERAVKEATLAAYAATVGMPEPCHYSHFVMETLVRFLFSRASTRKSSHSDAHLYIKLTQLLRLFCGPDWHFDLETLSTLKHDIINRLSLAVATREIDLQEELLKLLQRLLLRPTTPLAARKSSSASADEKHDLAEADQQNSALLLQAVHSGITDQHNNDILASWLEFSIILGNSLPSSLRPLLFPLIDVISSEIRRLSLEISRVSDSAASDAGREDNLILLVQTVDSLVHYTLGDGFNKGNVKLSRQSVAPAESTGILGYVFSSTAAESEITNIENGLPKTAGLESMRSVISLLIGIYQQCSQTSEFQVEKQARASLASFYRLHPQEFLESVIDIAFGENPIKNPLGIVDAVAESAHQVVELISSAVSRRLSGADDQRKRNISLASESNMLSFLRDYILKLEAPIAVQAGSFCLSLSKALVQTSNSSQRKRLAPGIFEVLTVVLQKVSSTSALTDRRYRKDVQDTFFRTLEVVSGALNEGVVSLNQGDSLHKDIRVRVDETRQFLAAVAVPSLRAILIEEDRILQAASVILNAFVLPTLRSRARTESTNERQALDILNSVSRMTQTLKLWKNVVLDTFNDPGFFEMRPDIRPGWRSIIATLMDQDRERISELLVRVGAPLSGNFFSNKEQEALTKVGNVRRLSVVLFAAEADHYVNQLPLIQERLVEILRTPTVFPKITAEVYLCLRVVLVRFSAGHLTNFWPLILTELIKIFEETMDHVPRDDSDQLTIVLAACKFVDLLIALQMEDFQIHQWMFLTDTANASEGPASGSDSILNRLAEALLEARARETNIEEPPLSLDHIHASLRRPVLARTYRLASIQTMCPFLVKASVLAYEGVYQASKGADWEFIEGALEDEIFRAV